MSARRTTSNVRPPSPPENAPRHYRIVVTGHPLSPNKRNASSLKARMRDTRTFRDAVAYGTIGTFHGPPMQKAHVMVTLVRTDGRFYDPDNAVGTVKHLVDGLCVKHGGTVLLDDSRDHVTVDVRQEKGTARLCVVEVEEIV